MYSRYVIADYEHDNFSVSQCSWESGASPHIIPIKSPSAPDDTNHTPSNKLSSGAIAGIVIGAVVALLVLGLLGFIFWRKRGTKETKHTQETKNSPVEIDSGMKDPYLVSPGGMHKDHPQSPELDVVEHKGHELDGQTCFDQVSPTNEHPVELPATERQSRTLSSPISLMSEMSDSTRLHRREPSDPTSIMRARSDATRMHRREPSDPVSPTRQRSDATRLHKRELSDPVSLLSERRGSGVGNL